MPIPIGQFFEFIHDDHKKKKPPVLASNDEINNLLKLWENKIEDDIVIIPETMSSYELTRLKTRGLITVSNGKTKITSIGRTLIRNHLLKEQSTFDKNRKKDKFVIANAEAYHVDATASKINIKKPISEVKLISIASTPEDQSYGMKYRKTMGANEGMLFKFSHPQHLSFWMENTYIPLDIAFIDENHKIVQIENMAPCSTKSHRSKDKCVYALEVPMGFFSKNGIKIGHKIDIDSKNNSVKILD